MNPSFPGRPLPRRPRFLSQFMDRRDLFLRSLRLTSDSNRSIFDVPNNPNTRFSKNRCAREAKTTKHEDTPFKKFWNMGWF